MDVVIPAGSRVNSKNYRPVKKDLSSSENLTFYEGLITALFLPWLVDEIPDGKWQTLQAKLKSIIIKIIMTNGRKKLCK
jgi:hypothetical protein